jgi:hypothetical protein
MATASNQSQQTDDLAPSSIHLQHYLVLDFPANLYLQPLLVLGYLLISHVSILISHPPVLGAPAQLSDHGDSNA